MSLSNDKLKAMVKILQGRWKVCEGSIYYCSEHDEFFDSDKEPCQTCYSEFKYIVVGHSHSSAMIS